MLQGVLSLFARGGEKVVAGATEQLAQVWLVVDTYNYWNHNWLVLWNMFFSYIGNSNPN